MTGGGPKSVVFSKTSTNPQTKPQIRNMVAEPYIPLCSNELADSPSNVDQLTGEFHSLQKPTGKQGKVLGMRLTRIPVWVRQNGYETARAFHFSVAWKCAIHFHPTVPQAFSAFGLRVWAPGKRFRSPRFLGWSTGVGVQPSALGSLDL